MGIAGFNALLKKLYPEAVKNMQFGESYDHVFIDMSDLFHKVTRKKGNMLQGLIKEIEQILRFCHPKKSIYFAFDGPASLAKLKTQRERRITKQGQVIDDSEQNQLSAGMELLDRLRVGLENYASKLVNKRGGRDFRVVVDSASSPGEGEVKIIKEIKRIEKKTPRDSFMVVGGDNDIAIMGLCCETDKFYIYKKQDKEMIDVPSWRRAITNKKVWKDVGVQDSRCIPTDLAFLFIFKGNDYIYRLRYFDMEKMLNAYYQVKKKFPSEKLIHLNEKRNPFSVRINLSFLKSVLELNGKVVPGNNKRRINDSNDHEPPSKQQKIEGTKEEAVEGEENEEVEEKVEIAEEEPIEESAPKSASIGNTHEAEKNYLRMMKWIFSMWSTGECSDYLLRLEENSIRTSTYSLIGYLNTLSIPSLDELNGNAFELKGYDDLFEIKDMKNNPPKPYQYPLFVYNGAYVHLIAEPLRHIMNEGPVSEMFWNTSLFDDSKLRSYFKNISQDKLVGINPFLLDFQSPKVMLKSNTLENARSNGEKHQNNHQQRGGYERNNQWHSNNRDRTERYNRETYRKEENFQRRSYSHPNSNSNYKVEGNLKRNNETVEGHPNNQQTRFHKNFNSEEPSQKKHKIFEKEAPSPRPSYDGKYNSSSVYPVSKTTMVKSAAKPAKPVRKTETK
eukprot:TRINITY_DN5627_c0_g1_i1.p1 TRINITY_DN5627_c0_g1~~TRINITY_DN5627_c0_g1_i1.p1  ORF type:complete len:673 (-),score=163.47 TRINITY_DN5627_c0_g1_i1:1939-3957(-)